MGGGGGGSDPEAPRRRPIYPCLGNVLLWRQRIEDELYNNAKKRPNPVSHVNDFHVGDRGTVFEVERHATFYRLKPHWGKQPIEGAAAGPKKTRSASSLPIPMSTYQATSSRDGQYCKDSAWGTADTQLPKMMTKTGGAATGGAATGASRPSLSASGSSTVALSPGEMARRRRILKWEAKRAAETSGKTTASSTLNVLRAAV